MKLPILSDWPEANRAVDVLNVSYQLVIILVGLHLGFERIEFFDRISEFFDTESEGTRRTPTLFIPNDDVVVGGVEFVTVAATSRHKNLLTKGTGKIIFSLKE